MEDILTNLRSGCGRHRHHWHFGVILPQNFQIPVVRTKVVPPLDRGNRRLLNRREIKTPTWLTQCASSMTNLASRFLLYRASITCFSFPEAAICMRNHKNGKWDRDGLDSKTIHLEPIPRSVPGSVTDRKSARTISKRRAFLFN